MNLDNYNPFKPHLFIDSKEQIIYYNYINKLGYYIPKDKMNKYYVFSTDIGGKDQFKAGIQIRESSDLIHWRFVGRAFSDGVLKEAYDWTEAKGLWAPEVVKMNGKFYLYYAASQFGKTQSFIYL